jgi:CubicO group peptidase (beta-lactamase class C family)
MRRLTVCWLLGTAALVAGVPDAFPEASWVQTPPAEEGLDAEKLSAFAERVGGDGCVVRNGRMVYQWGRVSTPRDWASASKPVLATLLLSAIQHRLLPSVHTPVAHVGWPIAGKDTGITFLHLTNMTSGYARGEPPGTAWAYNDYGIQLLTKSLERVYKVPLDQAAKVPFASLQFQDGPIFGGREGRRVVLSPRDMARFGLFWLNEGRWQDQKLISNKLFTANVRIQVPSSLPRSFGIGEHDYLGIGTYGGGSNQSPFGPGAYGFGFWFNGILRTGKHAWPAAPDDAFQANGAWNSHTVTMFPSLKMVVVSLAQHPGKFSPGKRDSPADRNMRLLMDAVMTGRPKKE